MPLEIVNLLSRGAVPYEEALALQRARVQARTAGTVPDALILLAHPPTITYGKSADTARHLLLPHDEYAARGIALVATDRGGDVTYHGPGQLVGYPVIHLGEGNRDLHRYVRSLEEVILRACGQLGVPGASRVDWHAGVWVGNGYLAALGVRVSRWVTHHGFALNVSEEVRDDFATIVPCGVAGKEITTVSEQAGRSVSLAEAGAAVTAAFREVFGYTGNGT